MHWIGFPTHPETFTARSHFTVCVSACVFIHIFLNFRSLQLWTRTVLSWLKKTKKPHTQKKKKNIYIYLKNEKKQDVGWLESGIADRVRSYFSNFCGSTVGNWFRRLGGGGGSFQRVQRCWLCQREARFEGIFVYVLIVKLVHFIYIVFYTYYSVESSEYIENALYFSISQMNYCQPPRFQLYRSFLFSFFHLGPKTADRISIFTFDFVSDFYFLRF